MHIARLALSSSRKAALTASFSSTRFIARGRGSLKATENAGLAASSRCLQQQTSNSFRGYCQMVEPEEKPMSPMMRRVGVAFFLACTAGISSLGFWQIRRGKEKAKTLNKREEKINNAPIELPFFRGTSASVDELEYQPMVLEGEFIHGEEFYYGPRSAPRDLGVAGVGFYCVAPFRLTTGQTVFVNRGWISQSMAERSLRKGGQVKDQEEAKGVVSLVGILRKGDEKPASYMPPNNISERKYMWMDLSGMAQIVGIKDGLVDGTPLYFDAAREYKESGELAHEWPLPVDRRQYTDVKVTPSVHNMYAATWFAISAGMLGITYFRFKKGKPAATDLRRVVIQDKDGKSRFSHKGSAE